MVNELKKCLGTNDFFNGHRLFAFDAREVVKVAPDVVVAALVEIDAVFYSDNQIVEIPCRDFQLLQFDGALHDGLSLEGEALGLQGAEQAVGILGRAVQGTKLHQGLVVEAGLLAVEELVGESGEGFGAFIIINRCVDVEEA